jgi:hypothetical protein
MCGIRNALRMIGLAEFGMKINYETRERRETETPYLSRLLRVS